MADSYPALIELIGRLEGKDRNVCETALYCLNAADRRDNRLRTKMETQAAKIRMLRAALRPFAAPDWCEYATFTGHDLRRASAALKETGDE